MLVCDQRPTLGVRSHHSNELARWRRGQQRSVEIASSEAVAHEAEPHRIR
jgi:hypothetical protein